MKKLKYILILLFIFSVACDKPFGDNMGVDNPDQFSTVYSVQAIDDSTKNSLKIPMNIDTTFNVYANFGGIKSPDQDISVKFKVAKDLVDVYNEENKTSYQMMLDGSYSIENLEAVIKKGELISTPIKVKINSSVFDGVGTFILPMHIESVTPDIKIKEDLRTAYIFINGYYTENPFELIKRDDWSIDSYSSQETPAAEGTNIGSAHAVLDNLGNTFWCTEWKATKPGPPHYISINMGVPTELHGLVLRGRSVDDIGTPRSVGNPRILFVETKADDNSEWVNIGTFGLPNILENTLYLDHKITAKYFKITITASHGDFYGTHLSEINAF